ncbi:DUF2290 domain-containing protein [Niallia sp. FSL R7-0648]|uniref:DUF2290 domain-containing protein n=1 Tax=Niallia sp. FSL R7-0648 TaxID=2954521 RepID=UPI0030F7D951
MNNLSSKDLLKQINQITTLLISTGLSVDQNFPAITNKNDKIILDISNPNVTNIFMKNISYDVVYNTINSERAYNLKLIDGAFLRYQYTFSTSDDLKKGRLSFFPSPNLFAMDEESELYISDEIYGDIISVNIYPFPIRFDFDNDEAIEVIHPASHLTLGQYKNCRIPVSSPLTPFQFTDFILRHFYFMFYSSKLMNNDSFTSMRVGRFDDTITNMERELSYLNIYNNN